MISWLQDNNIEMHSTHNEGKSVVAERFIRTLKTKIYKYITSTSKNEYIDKLDEQCINTYHKTIKMKPVDLNSEEIVGTFYEKELQITNQKEFRIEKVIKKRK